MVVIKKALITEKTLREYKEGRKVTFEVALNADKTRVKKAVEELFGVKVLECKMINRLGKFKLNRLTRKMGRTQDRKIAILTLKEGDKLDLFEK